MASTMVFCDRGKVNVTVKDGLEPTKVIKFEVFNRGGVNNGEYIPPQSEEVTLFVTEEQIEQIADSLFGQMLVRKARKEGCDDA